MTEAQKSQLRHEHNGEGCMQIGDVAERTGLSLRTIRYYEEAGLAAPATRSSGGFRLYTAADCDRLRLVRQMKPLGFTLEEMREILEILDQLSAVPVTEDAETLHERLLGFARLAQERCDRLREQLAAATGFTDMLHGRLNASRTENGER